MPAISAIIRVMESAARKAGGRLRRDFGEVEHLQVSRKGPADFVSKADKQAEQTLVEELQKVEDGDLVAELVANSLKLPSSRRVATNEPLLALVA